MLVLMIMNNALCYKICGLIHNYLQHTLRFDLVDLYSLSSYMKFVCCLKDVKFPLKLWSVEVTFWMLLLIIVLCNV